MDEEMLGDLKDDGRIVFEVKQADKSLPIKLIFADIRYS
jgi:hypothetical protein